MITLYVGSIKEYYGTQVIIMNTDSNGRHIVQNIDGTVLENVRPASITYVS